MKKLLTVVLILFGVFTYAQTSPPSVGPGNTAENGVFDTITGISSDGLHEKYLLGDLNVNKKIIVGGSSIQSSTLLCSAGYFDVYGETGCGFESTTTPSLIPIHAARQAVLCQVFTDISNFITNKGGNSNKVRVLIKSSGTIASAATSLQLGRGTAFFLTPATSVGPIGGITDAATWLTINTGQDAYYNLVGGYNGQFFHGDLAFNFLNTTGIFWNTGLTTGPVTGEVDLYTVILHEANHILGFMSLIDYQGQSRVLAGPYFNRYDKYLTTPAGNSLIVPTGTCAAFTYSWNIASIPNPTLTLSPGHTISACPSFPVSNQSNNTTCTTSIRFAGTNTVSVYTQDCFVRDGSLSHFEDQCAPVPAGNADKYFNMCNSSVTGTASARRFYREEERSALCDIGYSVGTSYGASGNFQHPYSYTASACPGISVAGVNDGILANGLYAFTTNVGSASSAISPLTNDLGSPASLSCLQLIYGAGTYTYGTTSFSFTPSSQGLHVFRYVPVSSSGEQGNITYVNIFALSTACTSTCDLISNGEFESSTGCGHNQNAITYNADCWTAGLGTPDFFKRSCSSVAGYTIPAFGVNTWNFPTVVNNSFFSLTAYDEFNESIQGQLGTPLVNGTTYTLRGWFHTLQLNAFSPATPLIIDVTASSGPYVPGATNTSTYPSGLIPITTLTVPTHNTWTYLNSTFTYTGSTNGTFIQIRLPFTGNITSGTQSGYTAIIDGLSLLSPTVIPTFTLPTNICSGGTIPDLSLYASVAGVFSGAGVTYSGGLYSFTSSTLGLNPIVHTYTNASGCVITTPATINVITNPSMTVSPTTATICPSGTIALTATGSNYFTWLPGSLTGTQVVVSPSVATVYTVSPGIGCASVGYSSVSMLVPDAATITSNPPSGLCPGYSTATLTAFGPLTSYTWNTGANTNTISASPASTTVYTVTTTDANGCLANATYSLFVNSTCTCNPQNGTIITAGTISGANLVGGSYAINGNINLAGYATFANVDIQVAPGVSITVAPNATLNIGNSHIYSCYSQWSGIKLANTGRIVTTNGTLIEDANIAILAASQTPTNGSLISVTETVFNKNNIGISINNYTKTITTAPYSITKSVFTSRDFTFTPTDWPYHSNLTQTCTPASSLGSPYCLQNFPPINPKSPNNSDPAYIGISLSNVGTTTNPTTTPVYTGIRIGDHTNSQYMNLFDNLRFGISSNNSNAIILQNVFQNTRYRFVHGSYLEGVAIEARSDDSYSNLLDLTAPGSYSTTANNIFFDCNYAVRTTNIFELDAQCMRIQSTQTASANFQAGKYGIYNSSSKYSLHDVNYNKILNIENGITFNSTYGSIVFGASSYFDTQYAGQVSITNNSIAPVPSGGITNEFVSNAITVENALSPPSYTLLTASPSLNVSDNVMNEVYRGINGINLVNPPLMAQNNTATLSLDPNGNLQNGISISACTNPSVQLNSILGPNTTNTITTGIYASMNSAPKVTCNTVSTTYQGFEFAGTQAGTKWKGNSLTTHTLGMALTSATIGAQGSASNPSDNAWNTPAFWTGSNLHTWTSGSDAANSTLFLQNTAVFNPTNNAGAPNALSYAFFGISMTTGAYSCAGGGAKFMSGGDECDSLCIDLLEKIATSDYNLNNKFDAGTYIAQYQLYKILDSDPALVSKNTAFSSFYSGNKTTALGKILDGQKDLISGNYGSATGALASISSKNNIESNYEEFYNIYNKYYSNSFTDTDNNQLLRLANKCPYLEGEVIYEARAMYNIINSTVELFKDNCPEKDNGSSRLKNGGVSSSSEWIADIYPVPASNELFIRTNNQSEAVKVTITDVNGKVVGDYELTTNNSIGNIKLDMSSGIYFVTLSNSNGEKAIKKLVITK